MKDLSARTPGVSKLGLMSLLIAAFFSVVSCKKESKTETEEKMPEEGKKENVVEIVTNVMDFQSADTIPSGWITLRYVNKSSEAHFVLIDKYPEGKTEKDAIEEVNPVFQDAMHLINQGKQEEGFAEFGKMPEWFSQVYQVGGVGLVSPKTSAETTLRLEPGEYIIECYVKMANGTFHTTMGMAKTIVASDQDSGNKPPEPTVGIKISTAEGIRYDKAIQKGKHVFAVHFEDQGPHEHFVGHDVNLVKLIEGSDLGVLEAWMNWVDPKGLISPPPAGVIFMGGVNDMQAGGTGYFQAYLGPGNYAFISEVPNAMSKNMLKTFTVVE